MKYIKMVGIAAIVAAALMAFAGNTTASATVLCQTEGNVSPTGTACLEGWAYQTGIEIHALNRETFKLTTSFKNFECTESTIQGKTSNEGGATEAVKVSLELWSFGGCNCEVKVLTPGSLEIHWIEGTHNGMLISKGFETTSSCSTIFGTVHCIYETGAGTNLGTATGGKELKVDISESNIPRSVTSALCAEKASWDVTYKVTNPDPIYIAGHT